jgi:hypothetical protein
MTTPADPTAEWPPLPRTVQGLAGRIAVRQPWRVDPEIPDIVGYWHSRERRIDVDRRLSRGVKWQVGFHEFVHSAIADAGIPLDHELEERVCDAVGSALCAALEHYLLHRRPDLQ